MTVAELIQKLSSFPPDAVCIYQCCSDWEKLDADDVEFVSAEESKKKVDEHTSKYISTVSDAICYRDGRYCQAYANRVYVNETPVYHDVVTFP